MVSACVFSVVLFHPESPVAEWSLWIRNSLMGLAMGLTAVAIICSPWGKRSGAHFNPAVTITFYRLNRIGRTDAVMYALSHFIGGTAGVLVSWMILGERLAASTVNFVVTVPGNSGTAAAFAAEFAIAFVMMSAILAAGSTRFSKFTPYIAGTLLAIFITVESHISGTSMNPARTFASSVVAGNWSAWWVYAAAPVLAMLAAGELHHRVRGTQAFLLAKIDDGCSQSCRSIYQSARADEAIEITKQPNRFPIVTGLF